MDLEKIKEQTRRGWSTGEYSGLSEMLRPAARALADACAVSAGQEVLDVAAGDGNFAVACAEEGASVVASDIAPGMVERGRGRAEAEGVEIEWVEADAEDLPFEDGRFECAGSVFGAMFAPRWEVARDELFRVVRAGNTVGLACWTPDSGATEMFRIGRSYAPPSEVPPAEEWGSEEVVRERLADVANSIECTTATLTWSADSPEDFMERMEVHSPMQAAAKASMEPDTYARMRGEFLDLARRWAGGDGPFAMEMEYLITVARKRG